MEWYTENVFKSIILFRIFPQWTEPYVAQVVPYVWMVRYQAAGTVLGDEKLDNLLRLMDNVATGIDGKPDELAGRTLVLTLASSHTISMPVCQALFQMCEHPQYIFELREEVRDVVEGEFEVAFSKIDGVARRFQRKIHQSTDGLGIFVLLDVPRNPQLSVLEG